MKKGSKIVIAGLALASIVATVCIVVPQIKKQERQEEQEKQKPSRDYSTEEIAESDKIKEKLENIDDKINSGITIPEDATEEEKKELEEQKTYLSVLKVVKEIQKSKCQKLESYPNMESEILSIDKIMKNGNNLLVIANTIVKDADVYFMEQIYYEIFVGNDQIVNSKTPEEFVTKLNESKDVDMHELHMIYKKDDEFCSNIFNNYVINEPTIANLISNGYEAKLVNSGLVDPYAAAYSNKCILAIEMKGEESKQYFLLEISFHNAQEKFGVEGLREKIKNGDADVNLFYKSFSIFDDLGIDFGSTYESLYDSTSTKNDEAQAQAEIEEISTRNENGNVTGFDWNAYKDLMKQKEAEKEAKELEQTATQQESVTYSDQELSL